MARHHLVVAALAAACLAGAGAAHPGHAADSAVVTPAAPDRFLTVDGVRFRLRDEGPDALRSRRTHTARTNAEFALIGHGAAPQCAKDRADTEA